MYGADIPNLAVITQCCIDSLYKMGKDHQPVVDIAKTFERRKCNHREAIDSDECLKDVIGESWWQYRCHLTHH